jgi:transcriptional regulator with XRE-family HTH domain
MGIRKIQNELGRRLRWLRIDKDLTQEDVALEVEISRDHLSNIELGKHPINIKTLYKLAKFFDVDMKYFF